MDPSVRELREWQPLSDLLSKLPARVTRNLIVPQELSLTCVAAVPEFVALGTDAGLVFWYNRATGDMQKLRCESAAPIRCLHVVSSVEFMVAAGSDCGQVSVFQIQKEHPPDLDLVMPLTQTKPIERYTIRDVHAGSSVRCVRWTKNGMKLFSGDRRGVVVMTEFDFQLHISKSAEILNETYPIVQLDFRQPHLLVATTYRAICCDRHPHTGDWRVLQIGTKDRRVLGDFGVAFAPTTAPTPASCGQQSGSSGQALQQPNQPLIISARPGLRFWLATVDGAVQQTILFKAAMERINQSTFEVPLLCPVAPHLQSRLPATNFGPLHAFGADLMITHTEHSVYFLHLGQQKVVGTIRRMRQVTGLCVADGELFVLEGGRNLVRIAAAPERQRSAWHRQTASANRPATGPVEFEASAAPESPVLSAEECFELPPIEALHLVTPLHHSFAEHDLLVQDQRFLEHSRRVEVFERINELAYDESILFKQPKATARRQKEKSLTRVKLPQAATGIVEIGRHAEVVDGPAKAVAKVAKVAKVVEVDQRLAVEEEPQPVAEEQRFSSTTAATKDNAHASSPISQELPQLPQISSAFPQPPVSYTAFQSPTRYPPYVLDCPTERPFPGASNLSDDMKKQAATASTGAIVSPSEVRPLPGYMNVPNLWNMEIVRIPEEAAGTGGASVDAMSAEDAAGEPLSLSSETSSFEIIDL